MNKFLFSPLGLCYLCKTKELQLIIRYEKNLFPAYSDGSSVS